MTTSTHMASMLKNLYRSGIVGDVLKGNLTVKPDNTIERILCMRRYDNGTCRFYEQPTFVSNVVCNNTETNYFMLNYFMPVDRVPFFAMDQTKMKCNLLGDALEGTVFIMYWFYNERHVVCYDVPYEDVVFPLYKASEGESQQQLVMTDDSNFVVFAHIVFRLDERATKRREVGKTNGNSTKVDGQPIKPERVANHIPETCSVTEDEGMCHLDDEPHDAASENNHLDISDLVKLFMGPMNDFHGMMTSDGKCTFDFTHVLDYSLYGKTPLCPSSYLKKGSTPCVMLTFGDMSTKEYVI